MPPPRPLDRRRPPAAVLCALVLLAAMTSGCAALGLDRTPVRPDQAQLLLQRAVGLTTGPNPTAVCTLSVSEASSCPRTIEDMADLQPSEEPQVACVVPAPEDGPLRGGQVMVLEGQDAAGEPYLTEFIVYDAGEELTVLDAVWWSGLTVIRYTDEEVEWEFNSASTACADGGLPVESGGA